MSKLFCHRLSTGWRMAMGLGGAVYSFDEKNLVGEGGQSGIHPARCRVPHDNAPVVYKSFRRGDTTRAESEFLALALLNQEPAVPGVVSLIDANEEGGEVVGLCLEFIEGASLLDLLKRGQVTWGRLAPIMKQLFEIVQNVHARGVLHRDLKPANIMVTTDGEGNERVKLIDFGLARILGTDRETPVGYFMGTPGYIVPEAILPADGYLLDDPCVDIYALGALAYEAITGSPYRKKPQEGGLNGLCAAISTDDGLADPTRSRRIARHFRFSDEGVKLEELIADMVNHESSLRPSLEEVIGRFGKLDHQALAASEVVGTPASSHLDDPPTVREPAIPAQPQARLPRRLLVLVGVTCFFLGILAVLGFLALHL